MGGIIVMANAAVWEAEAGHSGIIQGDPKKLEHKYDCQLHDLGVSLFMMSIEIADHGGDVEHLD